MVQCLAVGTVRRGELEAADPHAQQPRSVILPAGQPPRVQLRRLPAEHRHAIPGLLAVDHGVIAERPDFLVREFFVTDLQFLQAHDVWRAALQPVRDEVHPRPQAVHVPGRDTHGVQRWWARCAGATSDARSPWRNPASHRDRSGARLTRRDEGAYSKICDRGTTQFRRDAWPVECSGAFATGS